MPLAKLLEACQKNDRQSQQALYRQFYGYGMSICLRFAHSEEEAQEILNDGFLKAFERLESFREQSSFKSWLRRIMINASIDHYRRYQKHYHQIELSYAQDQATQSVALENISAEEVMKMVQALPPAYRMAFVLFAVEGYGHKDIAKQLGISEGASKSNLSKARAKLRKMLDKWHGTQSEQYGRA